MMSTHANRKMVALPDGFVFNPVLDKCPGCGIALNGVGAAMPLNTNEENYVNQQQSRTGNRIELYVNGVLTQTLLTELAVAADYLLFMSGVVEALEKDKTSLENEANKSGRTVATAFRGIGSVPL